LTIGDLARVYDRRNPANGLVLDIIERCPIFTGKIDSTSNTLSINSTKLFLTNQVRQMVKELLVGQYAMADDVFEEKAKQLLVSSEDQHYLDARDKFVEYIKRVTSVLPVWKQIAELPEGLQRNRITDFRAEGWVCLSATGLVVLGRIGHEMFKNGVEKWEVYTDRLATIDWRRTGPVWQGNIIQNGKVMTQQTPVRTAFVKVRDIVGLSSPETVAA
jgi:hypothetical protein